MKWIEDNILAILTFLGGISAVFLSGFFINSRIRAVIAEETSELRGEVIEMQKRLKEHEDNAVPVKRYEREITNLCELIKDLRAVIDDRFDTLTSRIDTVVNHRV